MSTSPSVAWLVGSCNTTSSGRLSRWPALVKLWVASPSPLRILCFSTSFCRRYATSKSPYWPGVPIALLPWALTAESSKLAPFSETELMAADRAATASDDGSRLWNTEHFVSSKGRFCGGVYVTERPLSDLTASLLGPFLFSNLICSLPHKLFLKSIPSKTSPAPKSLSHVVIS